MAPDWPLFGEVARLVGLGWSPEQISGRRKREEARAAVVGALASYGARTQHDLTETAQILVLGFSTVDSLAESTGSGMAVNERLRLRGNAVALVRSKKTCAQALSNNRSISDSPYAEAADYAEAAEYKETAEQAQHDQAPANPQPAAQYSIFQRARERALQTENPAVVTTPEPAAPSPAATAPAATASSASLSPAPVSGQTAALLADEQDEGATLWAGVMSHVAGNRGQAGTHATG